MTTGGDKNQVGGQDSPLVGLLNDLKSKRDPSKWGNGRPSDASVEVVTVTELQDIATRYAKVEGDKRHGKLEKDKSDLQKAMNWGNLALGELPKLQTEIESLRAERQEILSKADGGANVAARMKALDERQMALIKKEAEINLKDLQFVAEVEAHRPIIEKANSAMSLLEVASVAQEVGIESGKLLELGPFENRDHITRMAQTLKTVGVAQAGKAGDKSPSSGLGSAGSAIPTERERNLAALAEAKARGSAGVKL